MTRRRRIPAGGAIFALALAFTAGGAVAAEPPAQLTPPAPSMSDPGSSSPSPSNPPRLGDPPRTRLPPMVIPIDRSAPGPDRRPIYLGAGLVLVALVGWWNRSRRERFERTPDADRPRRTRSPGRPRDPDADDLHAAARGDGSEPGEREP